MSNDATAEHAEHAEHGHHGPELATYYKVFGALIVLTAVTVAVGQITWLPGAVTIAAAMIISTVKATLVCRYFMLLGYTDRFYTFILILSMVLLALMYTIASADLGTRNELYPDLEHAAEHATVVWGVVAS